MAIDTVLLEPPDTAAVPLSNPDALYEIIDGVRVETPPMSIYSTLIGKRLYDRMNAVATRTARGTATIETMFLLDTERRQGRRPDTAFVSAERWPLDRDVPEVGEWEVVPDLCAEVTSPHDLLDDVLGKVQEYFQYGVRQVWIVWPADRQVYVYRAPRDVTILTAEATLRAHDILPGFEITLEELFSRKPV
jgi:Uma2 family endonuclease